MMTVRALRTARAMIRLLNWLLPVPPASYWQRWWTRRCSRLLQQPGDPDQQDGADDRDDEPSRLNAHQAHQPSAHHRADDAEDDVHGRAVAAALHELARGPSRDQTDDYPPDQGSYHRSLHVRLRFTSSSDGLHRTH